ncbi:mCG147906 [Mus musculus]|nr:mCG147906 [Mus musculus]
MRGRWGAEFTRRMVGEKGCACVVGPRTAGSRETRREGMLGPGHSQRRRRKELRRMEGIS